MAAISFVKACQDFFSKGQHGKKIDILEFKALTRQDKEELREMLIVEQKYDVLPLPPPVVTSE